MFVVNLIFFPSKANTCRLKTYLAIDYPAKTAASSFAPATTCETRFESSGGSEWEPALLLHICIRRLAIQGINTWKIAEVSNSAKATCRLTTESKSFLQHGIIVCGLNIQWEQLLRTFLRWFRRKFDLGGLQKRAKQKATLDSANSQ